MRHFNIKDVEPEEVLKGIKLPFPHFRDEIPGDERPIVNIYRYRFYNNLGVEFSFLDKISSGHIRFLLYREGSKTIEKFGTPSWGNRSVMRHIVKICMSRDEKHKITAQRWKEDLQI